jgi:CheY-like chemotaxis protein
MTKILVVEDNEMNLDMLSRRLVRAGFEVVSATDGRAGLEKVRAERPDLVLMDMSLPEMDGWAVTRAVRADPAVAGTRIIALTAHAMASDREAALAAGCDDYDTKPVEFPRLLGKMRALLARERGDG